MTFCDKYHTFSLSEVKSEVENVLQILFMTKHTRILEEKHNIKFLFYDYLIDYENVISYFCKDVNDPCKHELAPILIELAVSFVQIMKEKNYFSIKLYELLLYPFTKNMDSCKFLS